MQLKNDAAGPCVCVCVCHHRAHRLSQHVHVWSSQKPIRPALLQQFILILLCHGIGLFT